MHCAPLIGRQVSVNIGIRSESQLTSSFALRFHTPNVITAIPTAATTVLDAQFEGRTHQPPRGKILLDGKNSAEMEYAPAGDHTYFG